MVTSPTANLCAQSQTDSGAQPTNRKPSHSDDHASSIAARISSRRSRVHCPGTLRSAAARDSASYCDALWPAQAGEPCAVYVIGIGGEWTFAEYALSKGCEVHAYDPTVELRARHLLRSRLYALVLPGHTQSLLLPSRWPRLASVIGVFSSKSRSRLPLPLGTGAAPHE